MVRQIGRWRMQRVALAVLMACALAALPAAGRADAPPGAATVLSKQTVTLDVLGADDPETARVTHNRRIFAVSAGVLAGAIAGTVLTAGASLPVLAGATASSASVTTGMVLLYAARVVAITASAVIGGFLGKWLSDY